MLWVPFADPMCDQNWSTQTFIFQGTRCDVCYLLVALGIQMYHAMVFVIYCSRPFWGYHGCKNTARAYRHDDSMGTTWLIH